MSFKKIFFLILFSIFFVHTAFSTETNFNLIDKLEKRYSNKTFRIDFFQESTLMALNIKETAVGSVIFSHPGKMMWEYKSPQKQTITTDGKTLWFYIENENKVMTGDAKAYFKEGIALLSNISDVKKNYNIKTGKNLISLIPLKKSSISKIELRVSGEKAKILSIKTINLSNDETILHFDNEKFLDSIDQNIFSFSIPEGASITKISQ